MRVLVTGATGFIGSHLVNALVNAGHSVVATKRATSVVPAASAFGKVQWVLADDDIADRLEQSGRVDVVFHLATGYFRDGARLLDVAQSNVQFPLALLDFATRGGAGLFVNADSFFSRPEYNYAYMREYIAAKQIFSRWGRTAVDCNEGFCFVNARLEHVYGAGDGPAKFVPSLIADLLADKPQINLTSCEQKRDFVHVQDVITALLAISTNKNKLAGYVEAGIGTGLARPLKELVTTAKELTGSHSVLNFNALPLRAGEIMHSSADCSLLSTLGWSAAIDLEAGLAGVVASLRPERGL